MVLQDHVTIKNISTTTMPMASKLGWVVTYSEELQLIASFDPSIMFSCEVT